MKIGFIVPYFGTFPSYFNIVLKTCESNKDIATWIFFTDDRNDYNWPSNCIVNYMSFSDMQEIIKKKFDEDVVIHKPYKLCDYKPAYGYIFEEYIRGFDFWGHCDVDCIFGKLSHFFSDRLFKYDKILRLGHMTLYKNNVENNKRFMLSINGKEVYREVYSTKESRMFDEDNSLNYLNIEDIWRRYNFSKYCMDNKIANIWYKGNLFRIVTQKQKSKYEIEPLRKSIFYWDKGELYRLIIKDDKLAKNEFIYMHLMARKMKNKIVGDDSCIIKITPNKFEQIDDVPNTLRKFKKEKWFSFNLQYFKVRYRNFKTKINRMLKGKQYNDR